MDTSSAARILRTPAAAMHLVERIDAALQILEHRSRFPCYSLVSSQGRQEFVDARCARPLAVPSLQEAEDVLLEVLHAHAGTGRAARAAGAENDVAAGEELPFSEEADGFDGGLFRFHASKA